MEQWAIIGLVVEMMVYKRGRVRTLGWLTVILGAPIVACTESGQILTSVDEVKAVEEPASAGGTTSTGTGGSSEGAGGSADAMGGAPELRLVEGPTGSSVFVGAGDVHTCATFDGALYCWGENQNGSLGLGDFESRNTPTRVGDGSDWSQVGSGDGFSCALGAGGSVWCWGRASSGQLGAALFTSSAVPVEVDLPGMVESLDVGQQHVCAIVDTGVLYCWGQNTEGQLAQSDPFPGPGVNSDVPLPVADAQSWQKVACGQGHTCAIQSDGSLWCWGRNTSGELGLGADAAQQLRNPTRVGSGVDWEDVSAGQNHTCGIRSGALYCWGDNSSFQLGRESDVDAWEPTLVSEIEGAEQVSIDTFHTCVIEAGGRLLCWGRNIEGQLGDGTLDETFVPTVALPEGDWEKISAGRFHSCGVSSGAVLCTGENVTGRLGVGDGERRYEFTPTAYYK